MTYIEIRNVAVNQDFIDRVMISIVMAAIAISAEASNAANHVNRVNYANAVLRNPPNFARNMAVGIATDTTVQSTPTDAAIYNAVAGQWNAYAGVEIEVVA